MPVQAATSLLAALYMGRAAVEEQARTAEQLRRAEEMNRRFRMYERMRMADTVAGFKGASASLKYASDMGSALAQRFLEDPDAYPMLKEASPLLGAIAKGAKSVARSTSSGVRRAGGKWSAPTVRTTAVPKVPGVQGAVKSAPKPSAALGSTRMDAAPTNLGATRASGSANLGATRASGSALGKTTADVAPTLPAPRAQSAVGAPASSAPTQRSAGQSLSGPISSTQPAAQQAVGRPAAPVSGGKFRNAQDIQPLQLPQKTRHGYASTGNNAPAMSSAGSGAGMARAQAQPLAAQSGTVSGASGGPLKAHAVQQQGPQQYATSAASTTQQGARNVQHAVGEAPAAQAAVSGPAAGAAQTAQTAGEAAPGMWDGAKSLAKKVGVVGSLGVGAGILGAGYLGSKALGTAKDYMMQPTGERSWGTPGATAPGSVGQYGY